MSADADALLLALCGSVKAQQPKKVPGKLDTFPLWKNVDVPVYLFAPHIPHP
jgi:hypothetical protein